MAISHLPRHVRVALLAFIVLALGAAAGTYYISGQRSPDLPQISKEQMAQIQPHRALYHLTLQRAKQGSNINNVDGRMMYAWSDACDAWTIEQRLDLNFQYDGGGTQRAKTSMATWEAKDSTLFRFNVKRETDGHEVEAFRGRALLARNGGEASYQDPDAHNVALQAGTIFPSTHTLELLRAAQAGQRLVTHEVFDGGDAAGLNHISAFISNAVDTVAPKDAPHAALRQGKTWPVRLAFFAPDNQTGTPDYEMTMMLLENGIATALTIDYGDFVVDATLETLEPLPQPTCS